MSRLRDLKKGTRAIKRVPLALVNCSSVYSPPVPELDDQRAIDASVVYGAGEEPDPATIDVGIRVLTGLEWATVHEKAGQFARERKVPDDQLNDRNPIYNLGCSVYTCVLACVDPDTSASDPDPFFGERGDPPEVAALDLLQSEQINRDSIQFLAAAQSLWEDRCSGTALQVAPHQMLAIVAGLASPDFGKAFDTFLGLRPGMQLQSARFMASQLAILQTLKSPTSSSSPSAKTANSEPS